ncbi:MAG: hypothetical protein ACO1SV_22855 [Fimbriimonas sp.]
MPWICSSCGEVSEGDMCLGCGKSRGHGPIVKDDRLAGYRSGPLVPGSGRLPMWGPYAWVFVGLLAAIIAAIAFYATVTPMPK